ncbi:hypothetical protein Tb11.01.6110 [Trypanosoma brucei brucei TREU927]|uniref:Uncharacterized protein n=1 Tax=Trypanosoma brucei brucei (strain 927/4 GUTat10.1) TaxID=185431 RepID=Q381Y6_TRYB2|nr:hypothetical protein Tb11.01.6110 [Trypanosoma brucei brucei TREU927]EAN80395.1 hypothetical protein Tb11.01.6110 [Trypanosoma brucei brucei TREU927]
MRGKTKKRKIYKRFSSLPKTETSTLPTVHSHTTCIRVQHVSHHLHAYICTLVSGMSHHRMWPSPITPSRTDATTTTTKTTTKNDTYSPHKKNTNTPHAKGRSYIVNLCHSFYSPTGDETVIWVTNVVRSCAAKYNYIPHILHSHETLVKRRCNENAANEKCLIRC